MNKMKDFPSCFGENIVQLADASCSSTGAVSKISQNLVTCIYQCKLFGKSCLVTLTWSKSMMGQCVSIELTNLSHQCICKVEIKPSLFSRRKGSKHLGVNSHKIDLYWDLSVAKFGSGPEPLEGYYIALVGNEEMVLIIGDLSKEAFKKSGAISSLSTAAKFICRREHISGKKVYATKSRFSDTGKIHYLEVVCETKGPDDDPSLVIHIDGRLVMQVKHLQWKFRGNCSILVDDLPVEIFWDVHHWLFGTSVGCAVFMFQTCSSAKKLWPDQTLCDDDCSMLSLPHSESFKDSKSSGLDFPLILYAWRNE